VAVAHYLLLKLTDVIMIKIDDLAGLIIDMDGVLWHGNKPIEGLVEFFSELRSSAIPFVLATNNASLTQQQYVDKLAGMGVDIDHCQILTSSMATAHYLIQHLPADKRRVFVIGEDGLRQPLVELGFTLTDLYQVNQPAKGIFDQGADLVVSGLDRQLTWDKLATATLNINGGAQFFATNSDTTLPTELGEVMGNGGVLAALEAVTGIKPISIGKPAPILYQQALALLGTDKTNTIAIGDRLNTDILGAINAGMRSIMVLTGVSTKQDIAESDYKPTWVMDNIQQITQTLRNHIISQ
jgi:4-nitrophenyl phosphatase